MKILAPLLLFILVLEGCTVINPFRKSPYKVFNSNLEEKPFDVIIVPGVPYNSVKWSFVMRSRILWAQFLFEKGYTKNIIFSGGAVYSPYVESRIMKLYGEALGIPKSNIFTEECAEHSTENIYYSYYLAKKLGFKNMALATDPYQTNNLNLYIKKNNFNLKILPIQFDTIRLMSTKEPSIDPYPAIQEKPFESIKDRESFFKRMKGTMGKNIPYTEEDEERKRTNGKR